MFDSILVANRGEIACRVIRTARKLGLRTIAVYHHEDRHAPHVQLADVAVELVADVPTAGYLDIPQLLDIAKAQGAQCIHPGYGFLSENAKFAEAVENAGLAFVGPQSEVIRLMGDKIHSREFAVKAGVPVSPSVKQEGDLDSFVEQASKIGFPLLIKAAAGGGGKGMSIVRSSGELAAKARTAMGEAERYFADGRVYAERYIERPRHIEVQVMGDGQGNVVHLFERECSVQRRFQKIIEESPAPNLPRALRDRICKAAVELAASAKYRNAGTVEFILGAGRRVLLPGDEHPAAGRASGHRDGVRRRSRRGAAARRGRQGPAVEAGRHQAARPRHRMPHLLRRTRTRLPPETGVAQLLRIPDGEGVRFDGGIRQGQAITAAFDPMVGKLICHGATRDEAIDGIVPRWTTSCCSASVTTSTTSARC
jgi:acetyl/propionyl-CoA carboxylase alpha subunit